VKLAAPEESPRERWIRIPACTNNLLGTPDLDSLTSAINALAVTYCAESVDPEGKTRSKALRGYEVVSIEPIKRALVRYTENKRPGRFGC
jgi:hypothetical protein